MNRKLTILFSLLSLILLAALPAGAAPLAGPCVAGQGYDPACDADHDGDIDVLDIQLIAGRWGTNGTYVDTSWALTGNAGTAPGANFIGTTDNQALEFRVNNQRVLSLVPASQSPNVIAGGSANAVSAGVYGAAIGGGGSQIGYNRVTDSYGTVGGGVNNRAGDGSGTTSDRLNATVGGGQNNIASGSDSTVSGGAGNSASSYGTVVAGGSGNLATGSVASIGGGINNAASGDVAVVGGGAENSASAEGATVAGGGQNVANWYATVGGGYGNIASGQFATIPGGSGNLASGNYSFAAGRRARATNAGAFVLADSNNFDLAPGVNNAFTARFTGGFRIMLGIDGTGGATWQCTVYNGGSWGCSSDRNVKENFQPVDGREVLAKLAALPITTWNAIGTDLNVRRMGPMSQDFYAAFGLGDSDKVITTGDLDGVALASIQGLYEIVQEQDAQIGALKQENAALQARLAAIEQAMGIGQ